MSTDTQTDGSAQAQPQTDGSAQAQPETQPQKTQARKRSGSGKTQTQTQTPKRVSLAAAAAQTTAAKRKPVFADVPNVPRVPLADGRVGCVQAELILNADGKVSHGPWMLTIPRRNADGSESGQRFPLADIQLLADGFKRAGLDLV